MDLGRPVARHIARRPQDVGDHIPSADRPPVDARTMTPDDSQVARTARSGPAPVDRPTR